MSIDDQTDLRRRLDNAFSVVGAGPVPVGRAIRQGRHIRRRRRLAAAAGVAAVTALAVALPLGLSGLNEPPDAAAGRHPVTENPPGPHAAPGMVAWGRIDARRWAVRAYQPGADGAGRGNQCVMALGVLSCAGVLAASGPAPASFSAVVQGPAQAAYGAVRQDVSYLTVRLAGGPVLILRPVRVYGVRLVAFGAPSGTVTAVTAYSRHGEIATAVPFQRRSHAMVFGNWVRPGQTGLPRATRRIGAGHGWSVTAYQGPWGRCLVQAGPGQDGSDCLPGTAPLGTAVAGWTDGSPRVIFGSASAAVAHVVVRLSDGSAVRAGVVSAGGQKYFAFAARPGARPLRWLAYNSARQGIARGTVR